MKPRDAFWGDNEPSQDKPDNGPNGQLMSEYWDTIHDNAVPSDRSLATDVQARHPKNLGTRFSMLVLLMAVISPTLLYIIFHTLKFFTKTPVVEIFNPVDGADDITQRMTVLSSTFLFWDSFNDPKDKSLQLSPPDDPTPRAAITHIVSELSKFITEDVECLMYTYQADPYGYKGPYRGNLILAEKTKHWTLANRTYGEFLDLSRLVTKWSIVALGRWVDTLREIRDDWNIEVRLHMSRFWEDIEHLYPLFKHEDWFVVNYTKLGTDMKESSNGSHLYGFPPFKVSGPAHAFLDQLYLWTLGHPLDIPLYFLSKCQAIDPRYPPSKFRSVHPACWLAHKRMENMTLDGRVNWLRDHFVKWVNDSAVFPPAEYDLVLDDVWPVGIARQPPLMGLATGLVGLEYDALRLLKIARELSVADLPDPPLKKFSWHRIMPWAHADREKRPPPARCLARLREETELLAFVLENYLAPQINVTLHTVIEFTAVIRDLVKYRNTLLHLMESSFAWVRIEESTGQRIYTKMPLLYQQLRGWVDTVFSLRRHQEEIWMNQYSVWEQWDFEHLIEQMRHFANQNTERSREVGK